MSRNSLRNVSDNDEMKSTQEGVEDDGVTEEVWECV